MEKIGEKDNKKTYLKPWCEVDYFKGGNFDAVLASGVNYGDDQDWDGRDLPDFPILDWE